MPDAQTTQERLEKAEKLIKSADFRRSVGPSGTAGYLVFDYPAKDELVVREWVGYQKRRNNPAIDGFALAVFDLYDIMIDILEQEGVLEQCYSFERSKGIERVAVAVGRLLKLNDDSSGGLIADYIHEQTPNNAVVLLIGVGKCYPVLRSHKIVNNINQVFDTVPVILFYPGVYGEPDLALFGSIMEKNYYLASKLV